jgi:transcriptional regulator with XRE-family HTH domain
MAGKKSDLGPTGVSVTHNVRRLRAAHGLTYAELSRRLADMGREIPPLGLRRIESGERRVDADDLVALALALSVSPVTLLMPGSPNGDSGVEVTGLVEPCPAERWWGWLTAGKPLPEPPTTLLMFGAMAWPRWFLKRIEHEGLTRIVEQMRVDHGDDQ